MLDAMQAGAPLAATEVERELLEICQLLPMPDKALKPDDNLFELGTSSLTLAQIYEKRVSAAAFTRATPRGHRFLRLPDGAHHGRVPRRKLTAEALMLG